MPTDPTEPIEKFNQAELNEMRELFRDWIYEVMDALEEDGPSLPNPEAAEEARRLIRCDVIPLMKEAFGGTLDAD